MHPLLLDFAQALLFILCFIYISHTLCKHKFGAKGIHLSALFVSSFITFVFYTSALLDLHYINGILYPFALPFFYITGPAAYLYVKSSVGRFRKSELWHYIPFAFFLIDLLLHAVKYPFAYEQNVLHVFEGRFAVLNHSMFFSPLFIFNLLPAYLFSYLFYTLYLSHQLRSKSFTRYLCYSLSIFCMGLAISNLTISNLVQFEKATLISIVVLMSITLSVAGYKLIALIQKNMSIRESVKNSGSANLSVDAGIIHIIEEHVRQEYENPNSPLLNHSITKEQYFELYDVPKNAWEHYFALQGMRFGQLKKDVRIHRAKNLINQGYLQTYSVEALSEEVGYQSRTSFYSAFEQISGLKFTTYRNSL